MSFTIPLTLALFMSPPTNDPFFDSLQPEQRIADFAAATVYDDPRGRPMGLRMRHRPSGFVLDLLRMQSVPQAFIWVNSAPPSEQGEPHTCEHLLLGKGRRGRAHAAVEGMSLGESSAFTMQVKTCYHMHTDSGAEVFYRLLESQLQALIHPDFSDEEIAREVCHLGIVSDPASGEARLEEKGTVYSEMVSAYERPWTALSNELGRLLYGADHPLARDSGGDPAAIRAMTPADLRRFHDATYHLSNMGMIVCLPPDVPVAEAAPRISQILRRVELEARPGDDPASFEDRLPEPRPAAPGTRRATSYPAHNPEAPSELVFAWPPIADLDLVEAGLLGLFVANLASGETSILHRRFIDSTRRVMETGASAVFGWVDDSRGHAVHLGLRHVSGETTEAEGAARVEGIIAAEIARIAELPPGAPELAELNERARGRLIQSRRAARHLLDVPPGFGYRSTGAGWLGHLDQLRKIDGFHKSLSLNELHDSIEAALDDVGNPWSARLAAWGLLDLAPFTVSAGPEPELIERNRRERQGRIEQARRELDERFGSAGAETLRRFSEHYDAASARIDSLTAAIETPAFIADPPMTLDESIDHREIEIGGAPALEAIFDHMSGGSIGLALSLDRVAPRRRLYVSSLASLLLDVGVIDAGRPISFDEMTEALRREIWGLHAYYSTSATTGRIELVVKAAGTGTEETLRALHWLRLGLLQPDWRPENLARIRDVVDADLAAVRDTPRGSEEGWVGAVELAWRLQSDPLHLGLSSYAAQTHDLLRLRWLLREDPGGVGELLRVLAALEPGGRQDCGAILERFGDPEYRPAESGWEGWLGALDEAGRALASEAAEDLAYAIAQSGDDSLVRDWSLVAHSIAQALVTPPARALAELRTTLDELLHRDNLRLFTIGDEALLEALRPPLAELVESLSPELSGPAERHHEKRVIARMRERGVARGVDPLYVGVVNPSTSSGVIVHTAPCGAYGDLERAELLDFLAVRIYGGGGAHSLFMKTWGAGLAYSNGLRARPAEGRVVYYAERCPDLAQTLRFVSGELSSADPDPALVEYAIAQAFDESRAGARYSYRGEALAADLVDGRGPDAVRAYREAILRLRDELGREGLHAELSARLRSACGRVLPGLSDQPPARGASFVVIGPETQIGSYEAYLKSVVPGAELFRVHPRDFWIVDDD